jgi:hypothetical protein
MPQRGMAETLFRAGARFRDDAVAVIDRARRMMEWTHIPYPWPAPAAAARPRLSVRRHVRRGRWRGNMT